MQATVMLVHRHDMELPVCLTQYEDDVPGDSTEPTACPFAEAEAFEPLCFLLTAALVCTALLPA